MAALCRLQELRKTFVPEYNARMEEAEKNSLYIFMRADIIRFNSFICCCC